MPGERVRVGILGIGFSLWCLLLSLWGCTGNPTPRWIASGHQQLESYKEAYLTGAAPRLAELRFQKVVAELKKGGDLDLLQKAWLTRMALQIASREPAEAGDYPALEAALPVAGHCHFHLLLTGNPTGIDAGLLPPTYRPFLAALQKGQADEVLRQLDRIEDPLSRLIAAGVTARHLAPREGLFLAATETASRMGWQRPLLAWLNELKGFYERTGEAAKGEAVDRRLALIAP